MIMMIVGRPRNGKTLSAVDMIVRHLARGGHYYGNVKLKLPGVVRRLEHLHGVLVTEEDLAKQVHIMTMDECAHWWLVAKGGTPELPALIVFEEMHKIWNSLDTLDDKQKGSLKRLGFEMATVHGHFHVDILLITQHEDNADRQWRRLTEYYVRCRDLTRMTMPIIGAMAAASNCIYRRMLECDNKTTAKLDLVRRSKSLFDCYDTYDNVSADWAMGKIEKANMKRVPGWKVWVPRAALFVCLLGVAGCVDKEKKAVQKAAEDVSRLAAAAAEVYQVSARASGPAPGAVVSADAVARAPALSADLERGDGVIELSALYKRATGEWVAVDVSGKLIYAGGRYNGADVTLVSGQGCALKRGRFVELCEFMDRKATEEKGNGYEPTESVNRFANPGQRSNGYVSRRP